MARKTPGSGPSSSGLGSPGALAAACAAALALVLTLGARTLPAPDGSWLAVLPPVWLAIAIVAGAIVLTLVWRRLAAAWPALGAWPIAAWSATALALLPWVPLPLPDAVLVWLGPAAWLGWIAAILTGLAAMAPAGDVGPAWLAWSRDRRRGGLAAGLLALAIFAAGYAAVHRILPGGDEPHYLIIAESLTRDGDLAIDDNHERGDYLAFFPGELTPDYLRRGVDRRIYSIHAPGLPVLLLPAYAAFGYAGAVAALLLISAWGARLAWRLVFDVTEDPGAAWFAWAAVVFASPVLFHAFTVFPDGVAGVATLAGVAVLVDLARARQVVSLARLAGAGAALATLPWLHSRAATIAVVVGAAIVGCAWWRRIGWRAMAAFAALPVASAIGWFAYFQTIYGTANPAAPYGGYTQTAVAHLPAGIAGLLFDAQFGLLVVAPVFAGAAIGLVRMLAGRAAVDPPSRRDDVALRIVAVTLLAAFAANLAASASYRMWWGGASAPARFVVPMLLSLALPIGIAWHRARGEAGRVLAVAALVVTAAITAILVGVDGGRLAYGSRETVAGWTRWASPVVDLARALPAIHRTSPGTATAIAAAWAGALTLAWIVLAAMERSTDPRARARVRPMGGLVAGLAATIAIGVAWRIDGGAPILGGGAEGAALAAWQSHPRATLIEAGRGVHRAGPAEARAHLVLEATPAGSGRQRRLDLPALPPGRYRLAHAGPIPAALALRVGRSGLDWRRLDATAVPQVLELDVPVALSPWSAWPLDASANATLDTPRFLTLEPLGPQPSTVDEGVEARQVVRYGAHDVFFTDDQSYPEAPGFWVRPGLSRVVVGETAGPFTVRVHNAPTANRVVLEAGTWTRTLDLAPGQDVSVDVPASGAATPLVIRPASGIRPFDADRRNRDFRRLGAFITIE
jgi:hypothetical protein